MSVYPKVRKNAVPDFTCAHCGIAGKRKRPKQIYCSMPCQWKARKVVPPRNCQWCGKLFQTDTRTAKFCSVACHNIFQTGRTAYNQVCQRCGNKFVSVQKVRKCCSRECFAVMRLKGTAPRNKYIRVNVNGENVLEHRYVMEQHIGRKLGPKEHVHHKDGSTTNNDISNLEILSPGDHRRRHAQMRRERLVAK